MSNLIKVTDRIPNKKGLYIVFGPHGVEIACYNTYYDCWDDATGDDYMRDKEFFSHWMELPPPPMAE